MSDNLRFKFDQLQNKNTLKNQAEEKSDKDFSMHTSESYVRNLLFVQKDGKQIFLNYAYLISGEYDPDANEIVLIFSSHIVYLRGQLLEGLYRAILEQSPKEI